MVDRTRSLGTDGSGVKGLTWAVWLRWEQEGVSRVWGCTELGAGVTRRGLTALDVDRALLRTGLRGRREVVMDRARSGRGRRVWATRGWGDAGPDLGSGCICTPGSGEPRGRSRGSGEQGWERGSGDGGSDRHCGVGAGPGGRGDAGSRARRRGGPEKEGVGPGGGSPSHLCPHLPRSRRQPVPAGPRRSQELAAPARGPAAEPGPAAAAHGNPPASAVANMAALSGNPAPSLRLSRRPRARPRPAPPPSASPRRGHAPARRRA